MTSNKSASLDLAFFESSSKNGSTVISRASIVNHHPILPVRASAFLEIDLWILQCLTSVINLWELQYCTSVIFGITPSASMYLTNIWDYPKKMWPIFRDRLGNPICKVLAIWLAFNPHRVATLCSSCSRENGHPNSRLAEKNPSFPAIFISIRGEVAIFYVTMFSYLRKILSCWFPLKGVLWCLLGWTVPRLTRFSIIGLPLWARRNHWKGDPAVDRKDPPQGVRHIWSKVLSGVSICSWLVHLPHTTNPFLIFKNFLFIKGANSFCQTTYHGFCPPTSIYHDSNLFSTKKMVLIANLPKFHPSSTHTQLLKACNFKKKTHTLPETKSSHLKTGGFSIGTSKLPGVYTLED